MAKIYTYVDGESHYHRMEKAWQRLYDDTASLHQLRYKDNQSKQMILVLPKARIFWTRRMSPSQRTTYFTSVTDNPESVHEVKTLLRNFGLESYVVIEKKQKAQQRQALLTEQRLIEKPKGVDAAIFVRMLEDAQHDLYDICNLYTSDADYIPVIEAVRRRGKVVVVHGIKDSLGPLSQFDHVPDSFIDLEEMLRDECQLVPRTMPEG